MYSRERWWDCSKRNTVFTIQTCNPTCKHFGIEAVEERGNCSICGRPYVDNQTVPSCARIVEYRARREGIIDRATAQLDSVMANKGWRAAYKVYDELAGEFFGNPCPFYEAQDAN